MVNKHRSFSNILPVFILSAIMLAACGTSGTPTTVPQPGTSTSAPITGTSTDVPVPDTATSVPATETSPSDGQALLESRCTACHTTRRITTSSYTADEWAQVVENMINKGAELDGDEKQRLIEYLAQTYP